MIEPRLASGVLISAIQRMVEAEGDFATVLKKGDAVSGAILLIGQVRGADPKLYERYPSLDGQTSWQMVDLRESGGIAVQEYWKKRCARDPDLWVFELDVASAARLDGLLAMFI
ncbi:DUF1491 family protein [Sphingorhabdus sp.]|uniref:DUF1491 family protein n=1 Tax=Sphingorhabdus sp. TaxID=1902408 RepID=UPI0037C5C557